jgi:hypothetical protein
MLTVIIGMLVALALAAVVLALVAVPARRAGRGVLTPEGEQLVIHARERTVEAMGSARERVGELAERLPVSRGDAGAPVPETIDLRDAPASTATTATTANERSRSAHRR